MTEHPRYFYSSWVLLTNSCNSFKGVVRFLSKIPTGVKIWIYKRHLLLSLCCLRFSSSLYWLAWLLVQYWGISSGGYSNKNKHRGWSWLLRNGDYHGGIATKLALNHYGRLLGYFSSTPYFLPSLCTSYSLELHLLQITLHSIPRLTSGNDLILTWSTM